MILQTNDHVTFIKSIIRNAFEDTDFEELNIHWIEKWCDRLNISMTNTTFH